MEKQLLTIYEAAQILNCHYQTIRNLIKRGELKAFKFTQAKSSKLMIKREEIENYLGGK